MVPSLAGSRSSSRVSLMQVQIILDLSRASCSGHADPLVVRCSLVYEDLPVSIRADG